MRILGVDPGSLITGFGVVEREASGGLVHVAHGTVRSGKTASLAARLAVLHRELCSVIELHRPDVVAVEQVFVAASPRSALVLGHARGVVLAAIGGAGLVAHELAPREIKKAVVGSGAASKVQVQSMVRELLSLEAKPQPDAADALACAICQAHATRLAGLGVVPSARRGRRRRSARFTVRQAR